MFEHVIGQEHALRTLRLMSESGRIPHTLLFAGPNGVGKSEAAFDFARTLLCENGPGSGCDSCPSCRRAARLEHPDLHVLFPFRAPPKKSEDYGKWVDRLVEHRGKLAGEPYFPAVYEKGLDITVALVSEVHEKLLESSFEGGRRVCVILMAERLNKTTANSLLKILEEPPDGVHFIMTAEQVSQVLTTIVSRSTILRFRRLRDEEIEGALEAAGIGDPEKRRLAAGLSDGSLKTAKILAGSDHTSLREQAGELFFRAARGGDVESLAAPFAWSREVAELEELIKGFARLTADVLETGAGFDPPEWDGGGRVRELAGSVDVRALEKLSIGLERGLDMLGRNVNASLVMASVFYEIRDTFGKTG